MKRIYCVRHAESEGNIGLLRHDSSSPLSGTGKEQAKIIAKRFKKISIDKIFVSPYLRTKDTAEEINKILQKPIEYTDLLTEIKRPSFLVGKLKESPEVLGTFDLIKENFHNPKWRHSDEETFEDLKTRALELLEYIKKQPEENILLVSHGVFLRMLIACVILGESLTSQEYWNFFVSTTIDNTGITVFKEEKWRDDDKVYWKLVTLNDYAHLEEIM